MRSREELKTIIRKVWESVLNKDSITDHDEFGDLGGDASTLIDVVYHLEIELEIELPVEVLIMMVTVEETAFAIEFLSKESTLESKYLSSDQLIKLKMNVSTLGTLVQDDSLIVKINESGSLPPIIWCFNSPGQEPLALTEHLSKDQPVYALISSVTLGKSQDILENLAMHYVDEILELYPEGPYYLGGNCRGAKVMCEIVFQLQKRGKYIEKLCLLEFFHPKLYDFSGELMLLFGKTSEYQRHELLNWGEKGWKEPFSNVPKVFFIPCGHGQFFREENIKYLKKYVHRFFTKKGLLRSFFQV